ncbi:cytochrome c oxidase subunit 6C-like [Aethina tumida]|uniref:cytochrome c oxidase subunit 6C-like n=1 Tax=Aethina tumida TaxID=116153 RepID=UPI00096B43E6|nr:cytochrome c oxidase subunit 6C-like [Aethina tumida]
MSSQCEEPTRVHKLQKPQMHGILATRIKRNLIIVLINTTLGAVAFHRFYIERRKKKYRDFYANYDIEREFSRMHARGVFDSTAIGKR